MKKYLFGLLAGCMCSLVVQAQFVAVHVLSDGTALPFATVAINSMNRSSADSTGTALIPRKWLTVGDTISAKYVGAQDAETIYEGQDELMLDLPGLNIESITILSDGSRKSLWRNIRRNKIRKAYQTFRYRFEIHKGDTTRISRGRAEYRTRPSADDDYEILGKVIDLDNGADLNEATIDVMKHIVNDAFVSLGFKKGVSTNKGIRIMKEHDDSDRHEIYTILRPALSIDSSGDESMKIYVDPASGNITKSIVGSEFKSAEWTYTADIVVSEGYYIPHEIECKIVFKKDKQKISYHIYDLQPERSRRKEPDDRLRPAVP